MDEDMWLALPCDLLVDIFSRLELTGVIRCAGACRPWRRAIIDNACCLCPRPDRFLPDLLLGFMETKWVLQEPPQPHLNRQRLRYIPASNTPAATSVSSIDGVSVDGRLYSHILSSRDGFLLLGVGSGGEDDRLQNLCLWNALTKICRVLPAAAFDDDSINRCMYVLTTAYDDEAAAVRILAVDWRQDVKDGTTFQIFSSTSGKWGPVKRSAKLPEDLQLAACVRYTNYGSVVVCHGGGGAAVVSWLLNVVPDPVLDVSPKKSSMCMFSMDLRTERTWTSEQLPEFGGAVDYSLVLAVSEEDRRLSLVRLLGLAHSQSHKIEVWVLDGCSEWSLRRTINNVQKMLPNCSTLRYMYLSGFCPRSGYLFGDGWDKHGDLIDHFLIGVDGITPRLFQRVESGAISAYMFPYEMDSSTYISKMNYF